MVALSMDADTKPTKAQLARRLRVNYEYKANTFQRWELLKYLHTLGVDKYSMGGGASRGDSIYSFKKSFAKECENPFYIGTQVHLPEVYSKIIAQWQERCPGAAERYSGRLQGYRLQV